MVQCHIPEEQNAENESYVYLLKCVFGFFLVMRLGSSCKRT